MFHFTCCELFEQSICEPSAKGVLSHLVNTNLINVLSLREGERLSCGADAAKSAALAMVPSWHIQRLIEAAQPHQPVQRSSYVSMIKGNLHTPLQTEEMKASWTLRSSAGPTVGAK
jgi:hypothetical protein